MKKSTQTEIVIPTWAGRSGPAYWGDHDYGSHDNQTTSFWLLLRGVVPMDPYSSFNDDCRAIGDLGLYVWLSVDGTVSIDLRMHDVGSLTLRESEQSLKALRRLFVKGKAFPFNHFVRDTYVHTELTKVLDALGIKRALAYHGINTCETYEPVSMAIKRISDAINERLEQMKLRQAA